MYNQPPFGEAYVTGLTINYRLLNKNSTPYYVSRTVTKAEMCLYVRRRSCDSNTQWKAEKDQVAVVMKHYINWV